MADRERFSLSLVSPALISVATLAFIVAWPYTHGMLPIRDDFIYLEPWLRGMDLLAMINYHWNGFFFRPVEIAGTYLINVQDLDSRYYLALNGLGLCLVIFLLWTLIRRVARNIGEVIDPRQLFFISALWLLCHTATTVTLWQLDTASQMWSAVAGLWLGLILWEIIERVLRERPLRLHVSLAAVVIVLGIFTKITFLGWCASYFLCVGVLLADSLRQKRAIGASLVYLMMLLSIIPACYLGARLFWGGFYFGNDNYTGELSVNVFQNIVLSIIGSLATGAVHTVRNPDAAWIIQGLTLAGILASLLLILQYFVGLWERTNLSHQFRKELLTVTSIALVSVLAMSASFPTSHISEIHLMGPNVGAAILLSLAILRPLTWISPISNSALRSSLNRGVRLLAISFVVFASVVGLYSRSQHFAITWQYAEPLLELAGEVDGSISAQVSPVNIVLTDRYLEQGFVHSTYVLPPSSVVLSSDLALWISTVAKRQDIRIYTSKTLPPGITPTLIVSGAELPRRPRY